MRSTKSFLCKYSIIFFICIFISSCSNEQNNEPKIKDTNSPDKIRLRISTLLTAIDYAPYVIAKYNKWFESDLKELNVEVEHLDPFQSPPPVNEALATNQVDAVFTAEIPTVIGKSAGIDVVIPWISATLNSEIITPKNSKIYSLQDLKGEPVAGLAGTGPHYGLVKSLQQHNLTINDIEFLDMFPPDAKAAFESNQVKAWAIWPPFVEMELVAGKARVIENVVSPIQVVLAMRGEYVQKNKKITKAFIDVLQRAKRWILSNQEESIQIISKELNLPIEVVKLAWPKIVWEVSAADQRIIDDVQNKADFIKNIGLVKRNVDVEKELFLTL